MAGIIAACQTALIIGWPPSLPYLEFDIAQFRYEFPCCYVDDFGCPVRSILPLYKACFD